jgi:hypothetical protein
MYNIFRRHSSDQNPTIVDTATTKREAKAKINAAIAGLGSSTSTPSKISRLDDVTGIKFTGIATTWSISYWFEKA